MAWHDYKLPLSKFGYVAKISSFFLNFMFSLFSSSINLSMISRMFPLHLNEDPLTLKDMILPFYYLDFCLLSTPLSPVCRYPFPV
ncbi:hypothetical protein P154DRAFT_268903 [Amniculicola lignicola CBS 123094]|uniref:Uncharacterized protein n=1 Tax=Amniculicola lignicola CBS 123094 TaxID=1392246 RepID=A0A6A5W9Q7_9PLEO|nr:hypothetical protein P154DRAFT_268903 [Amniculicola lignicola CBS 123094]